MSSDRNARTVYSTETGTICAGCGWPTNKCVCSSRAEAAVPQKLVAQLRLEKKGRGGKTVTVIYDLPRNTAFLRDLTNELKRTCGTGGTSAEEAVELQGDHRERVRDFLVKKGYVVKG